MAVFGQKAEACMEWRLTIKGMTDTFYVSFMCTKKTLLRADFS